MRLIPAAALALATLFAAPAAMAQSAATPPAKPAVTATPAPTTMPATSTKATMADKTPDAALLDVNSATKAQLDALPMIGSARADAIIKGRPYRTKTELSKILPSNAYDAIKDKIVARKQ